MGRRALTDAEKIEKGTFDPRYSAHARAAGRVAAKAVSNSSVADPSNIVAFPTLLEIPACRFALNDAAKALYNDLVRALFDNRQLTMLTHLEAEALAGAYSSAIDKAAAGKFVPHSAFKDILSQVGKLKQSETDRAYLGSDLPSKKNKFGTSGFANKR